ncbi:hypothetical protein JKF63_06451 [Porcisia hertigi]|uniref:Uncharacterized protein n=1 Tax=Porcisia hertigi TaxID=2761500 RepID=A0A836LJZ2_9TRYP|nr:hypothetical protein JKF63_06451 [Porcisia hertigi]
MYAAHATQMSFSLDSVAAKSSLQGALFSTPECGADGIPPVKSWSQSMTWTIGLTGTYYACVRTADSTVAADMGYVNQVVVSNIPAVSLARQPAITGVGELATVTRSVIDDSPSAVVAVGLSSTADCTTVFTVGHTTETGNSASFYVPESSPGVVYYCVSNRLTTDLSGGDSSESTIAVFYPLGSLELRTYSLSYPPLRTQATMEVGLDSDVVFGKGTFMRLTPAPLSSSSSSSTIDDDDACDAARKNVTMDFEVSSLISKLSPVLFPVEGNWLLCVREPSVVGGAYVRLRTLSVYGDAVATPSGVIVGLPATLSISAVPPSTTVSLTSDSACSTSMPVVATAQSSLAGTASLSFTYTSLGSLLLCVGYRGEHNSQGTPAQLMGAGTMESTHVRVVPPLAVASVATQLTFSAPGAALLNGYIAVLVPPSAADKSVPTTCPTSATAGLMHTGAIAVASFTPSIHMVGTAYLVCVGADESFVPTGTITVIAAPAVTTDPSALVFGLPAHVTFSREIMSLTQADAFAVIKTTDDCTSDLGVATVFTTGSVTTSTGAAEAFVAPLISTAVTSVRLCVAQKQRLVSDTLGYADAGVTELTQFTSVTRYAQRERPNTLVGKPLLTTSTLFLVRCNGAGCGAGNADAACSSSTAEKYITNSQSPLTAPVGTYFLCQGVSTMKAVVGANTTVEVVEPFQMRTSADTSKLRVYVPFAVSISGGPGGAGAKYTVNVRPASIACGASAAESQSFVIGGDTTEITITDLKPMQDIRFCVEPSSVDSFEVLTGTLQHYMAPVAVIGDRATTLRSGGVRSGATAVLSRTADCLGVVVGGGATPITDAKVTFSVASCGANAALTSLYYCEAVGGGAYASRGSVGLLRSSACSGGADASIAEVDAAPGAAIRRFGIDAAYLTSPRLSASSDCSVLLDAAVASVGYAPGVEERAAFYVCATLVGDAGVTFTTAHPTLRVANWAVSPTAAVSRYNATMGVAAGAAVRVNYATPSSETFWSTASDCSVRTASAAGLSGSSLTATYKTTGVRGLVYVCTVAPLTGAALAVAQFLSVTPPAVRRVSPAVVRGGEYRVTLVVEGAPPLYSMVPGADSGYMYSGYYLSASRDVYLSGDACLSVLAGTKEATVASSGSVSFATAGIAASVSTVSLCAVTAAGRATVLSGVVVAPGHVYPTTLVSGALDAPVYVPAYPGTTFQLSVSAKGCGSAAGMPSFTTDAEGYGAVDLVGGGGDALAPGTYTLCYGGAALESVKLVRASHFDVHSHVAAASPDAILRGLSTEVAVSRVLRGAPVRLAASSACSSVTEWIAYGTASDTGSLTLYVQVASEGPLAVCVGYPTASASSADVGLEYVRVGELRGLAARVYPSIAYVREATTLRFAGVEGLALAGYSAVFVPGARLCTAAGREFPKSILSGPDATSAVLHGTVNIGQLRADTVYRVCVTASFDGGYSDAGAVAAMEVPSVSTDPSVPVRGLPVQLYLPPRFTETAAVTLYIVVSGSATCNGDVSGSDAYGGGSVDRASGAAVAFVAPARASGVETVRVCIGSNESLVSGSLGYALGATLRLEQFHTSMKYLQRGMPNVLTGAPMITTRSLYIVPCDGPAECGADDVCRAKIRQGATSSATAVLDVPLGRYLLCQRATVGGVTSVVGANTTVEVVEPFQMRASADTSKLRVYVPFAVSISGGPGGAGAKYTVNVRPASIACGASAAESQSFVIGGDTTEITITDLKPMQDIRFCVEPSSVDSFEVLTGTLQHYMAPVAVIGDRATTLRSGGVRSGATAVLSRTADCLGVVVGGGATPITDAKVTFSVASCGANAALTSLYYCEAVGGGAYASRGSVGLLRSSACSGGADASIAEVDAAPGAAIRRFGIDAAYLTSPRLSASSDCSVLLDAAVASVGYAPGVEERAAFYVCATLVGDAGVTFTTAHPTLRVANWAVSPTAAVSRYNATMGVAAGAAVRVNYATPSSETFWSTASDCSVRTASAAGLSGSSLTATYKTTGVRGLVYVCTVAPLTGAALAVAQFLSVTPPAVRRVSPAVVRGGEYRVTLVVEGAPPLYSMVPGADSGYMYSGYYLSASRDVYLSGDACLSVLAGTKEATVASSGSVSFATAGIAASVSTVSLCAVTAAGRATVLSGVVVAPGHVYPTTLVSGALDAPVYVPVYPGTTFQLSASATGCGSAAGMPSFTTDAEGYGAVDLVGGGGDALAPGTYTLCYGGAALESVKLVRASHFDVRGTTFVVGVASTVPLLQDLTAAALVPGFSTVRSCTSVSTEHGTWAAVTSTSVSVTAKSVYTAGLYLCARAPVNGTLVALPGAWSEPRSIQFVESSMQLPSAGWDACTTYTLDQCYPPGASESAATSVMAVVHGDCCSASRQSAVVGRASMASGTCELSLDYDRVAAYPAGSTYHVCVWDSADDSVCTTVSEARVSTNCTRSGDAAHGLSHGAVAGIAVACVFGGGVMSVVSLVLWYVCSRGGSAVTPLGGEKRGNTATVTVVQGSMGRSSVCLTRRRCSHAGTVQEAKAVAEEVQEVRNPLDRSEQPEAVFGDHPFLRGSGCKRDAGRELSEASYSYSRAVCPIVAMTVARVMEQTNRGAVWRPSMAQRIEMWRRAVAASAGEPLAVPVCRSHLEESSFLPVCDVSPSDTEPTVPLKEAPQAPQRAAAAGERVRLPRTPLGNPAPIQQDRQVELPQQARPAGLNGALPLAVEQELSFSRRSKDCSLCAASNEPTLEDSLKWVTSDDDCDSEAAGVRPPERCPGGGTAAPLSAAGLTDGSLQEKREKSKLAPCFPKEEVHQRRQGTTPASEVEAHRSEQATDDRNNASSLRPALLRCLSNPITTLPASTPDTPASFENIQTMTAPSRVEPRWGPANATGVALAQDAPPQSLPLSEPPNPSLASDFDHLQHPAPDHSNCVSFAVALDTSGLLRLPPCEPAMRPDFLWPVQAQCMPHLHYQTPFLRESPLLMYSVYGKADAESGFSDSGGLASPRASALLSSPSPSSSSSGSYAADRFYRHLSQPQRF